MSNSARTRKNDLVYHIHDGSAAFRFQLSGDLSGHGVRDVEQTWRTASSVIGGRCLVVDLSSVTGMDPAGRALLEIWQVEGASMVVTSSSAKDRIESMMDLPVTLLGTNPKRYAWAPFHVASRWVAALLVLLFPGAGTAANRGGTKSTSAGSTNGAEKVQYGSGSELSRPVECGPTPHTLRGEISVVVQQQADHLGVQSVGLNCQHQRRHAANIFRVRVGPCIEQRLHESRRSPPTLRTSLRRERR
jgi:hypothetical protein